MLICHCNVVTECEIREATKKNCDSLEDIKKRCKACTSCEGCKDAVLEILEEELCKIRLIK